MSDNVGDRYDDAIAGLNRAADSILSTFDAKMAVIDDVAVRQRNEVAKSLAPDVLKAEQIRRIDVVADDFRRQVIDETRAQISTLKDSPQPAKAAVSESLIKRERPDAPWPN